MYSLESELLNLLFLADHIWSLKSIKPELKRLDKSIELLHLRLKTLEETVHFYETILDKSVSPVLIWTIIVFVRLGNYYKIQIEF